MLGPICLGNITLHCIQIIGDWVWTNTKVLYRAFRWNNNSLATLKRKVPWASWRFNSLQWRHNGRDCVPNHQRHDCLLNRSFRRRSKKKSSASLAFVRGIHRWSMNSPHKWPVTRKMFAFDDVIMSLVFTSPFPPPPTRHPNTPYPVIPAFVYKHPSYFFKP